MQIPNPGILLNMFHAHFVIHGLSACREMEGLSDIQ